MKLAEDAALDQKVQALLDRIPQEVDQMLAQLKTSLMNPMTRPQAKRGIWDRFKNSMSNLWWGRYNQDNPYFWKNKLGDDLGHAESRIVPIEEYRLFKEFCKQLEDQLDILFEDAIPGTENLAIMKTINRWGEELKALLTKTVKDHIYGAGGSSPSPVPTAPSSPAPSAPSRTAPVTDDEKDNDRRGAEAFAKQMRDRGDIKEDEYQQILGLAATNPKLALKRIQEIQKRKGTGTEITQKKQELRDRLEALKTQIEDEVHKKIQKHISDDELDLAEKELDKYEAEEPAATGDSFEDKKAATMDALEKAKEKGLPQDKYEQYKKAIEGATGPDTTTLDRVLAGLGRTATIEEPEASDIEPEAPAQSGNTEPADPSTYSSSISSYWDKKPNTGGKSWADLSPSEKAAWNSHGGGHHREIGKKELKGLVLPWILRLGDPRVDILYGRDRHHIWNELRRQERVELDNDPIKDRQDFERRLETAKRLEAAYVERLKRRGRKSDVEIAQDELEGDAMTGSGPKNPTEMPTDTSPEAPPENTSRTATMSELPPNVPPETSDEEEETNGRTSHVLDDNMSPHDALAEIGKAEEDGIITTDEGEELTTLVLDDKIKKAMRRLYRKMAEKERGDGDDEVETFENTIRPYMSRSIKERVEHFRKKLCVQ